LFEQLSAVLEDNRSKIIGRREMVSAQKAETIFLRASRKAR
jgi:hypothetical protein